MVAASCVYASPFIASEMARAAHASGSPAGERRRRFWAALLLVPLLACVAADTAGTSEHGTGQKLPCSAGGQGAVSPWAICGGRNGPGGQDAARATCASGQACSRQDE